MWLTIDEVWKVVRLTREACYFGVVQVLEPFVECGRVPCDLRSSKEVKKGVWQSHDRFEQSVQLFSVMVVAE